ncbi:hypothetical protein [Salinibacter sp.]|jgi:hypothetical protein|uniref:hypothetical protein n=1 Tax=Salinibacter sp. TaxID=2065818 RepID=UPI0021E76C9D|nr:hypothetical protein [Salinibacter sp.]
MHRLLLALLLVVLAACDSGGSSEPDTLEWDGTYRGDATVYTFEGNEIDTAEGNVILDVALADAEALDSVVVNAEYGNDGNGSNSGSFTQTYRRATALTPTRIVTREVFTVTGLVTIDGRIRLQRSGDAVRGKTRLRYTDDEDGVWPDSVRAEFSGLD